MRSCASISSPSAWSQRSLARNTLRLHIRLLHRAISLKSESGCYRIVFRQPVAISAQICCGCSGHIVGIMPKIWIFALGHVSSHDLSSIWNVLAVVVSACNSLVPFDISRVINVGKLTRMRPVSMKQKMNHFLKIRKCPSALFTQKRRSFHTNTKVT